MLLLDVESRVDEDPGPHPLVAFRVRPGVEEIGAGGTGRLVRPGAATREMNALGVVHYEGQGGLSRDGAAAARWYRMSSEQGNNAASQPRS